MDEKINNNHKAMLKTYEVGEFVFNPLSGTLVGPKQTVQLEPQLSTLLLVFVQHPSELVSKSQIVEALWAGRIVSDDAFRAVIKKLRKALADDAKSPRYLRTIPLKGYRLIANVVVHSGDGEGVIKTEAPLYAVPIVGIVAFVLVMLLYATSRKAAPEFDLLTDLDGSELRQSYNLALDQLVFSHRQNKDDYLQLYTKSLASGTTRRLTFDRANYANGHLSPDGSRLAYTRSTPDSSQTFVADFSPDGGLSNIQPLPSRIGEGRYLQAWNAAGDGLYLSDLTAQESSKGIAFYDLNTQALSQLTKPGGFGGGDIFARESHGGKYLAILRNASPGEFELVIQHLATGELAHVFPLQTNFTQLVWSQSDDEIVLSGFYGEFARYRLKNRQFDTIEVGANNVNDVFFRCGEGCFYVRQHDGNYLDLDFRPNPFNAQAVAFQAHTQSDGAESFPLFGPRTGGVYYANKRGKETQIVSSIDGKATVLARFPIDAVMSALQVNAAETQLSGILNNRLFTIDLATAELAFLSSELEMIVATHWHPDANSLSFTRIEQNRPVLYRYDFVEQTRIREADGRYAQLPLPDDDALVIDAELKVWIESQNQAPRLLTTLTSPSPNRWKVNNNALYYTARKENLTYLYRTDIATGKTESTLLAKNRFRIQFDLTDDGNSLVGVRSVLAQSNTVIMRL